MCRTFSILVVVLVPTVQPCRAQFESATTLADIRARSTISDGANTATEGIGGPVSDFFGGLDASFEAAPVLGKSAGLASAAQVTSFGLNSIISRSSVSAVIDDPDAILISGEAAGTSALYVWFTIDAARGWSFTRGSVTGVNASGLVSLHRLEGEHWWPVFLHVSIADTVLFDDDTGTIGPGTYQFTATVGAWASAEYRDFPASANWDFEFVLLAPPPACWGDANGDTFVNFDDVLAVLAHFDAEHFSETGAGDADQDGVVNFHDVVAVLVAFGASCGGE